MKRGLLKNFLVLLILFGSISACNLSYFEDAEFADFVWDPSLTIPVGDISYTIDELFNELNDAGAQVGSNDESIVTLSYSEALQSQPASAFLTVLDQSFGGSVQSGADFDNPGVSTSVTVNEVFEFNLSQRNEELYDSILFNAGNFDVQFSSELDARVDFTMEINSLINKSTGNTLVISGTLTPSGPEFQSNNNLGDFKGDFTLDAAGNTTQNTVVVDFEYTITIEPTTRIASTDRVTFDMNLTNAGFQTVFGNIGSQALDVSFEIVNLDFFRDFEAGAITFTEPVFDFVFDNSFGFPLGVDFTAITAIGNEGQIIPLSGSATNEPFVVSAPMVGDIGAVDQSVFTLNAENSNIADLLASQPRRVIMEVNAASNPPGVNQYNFVDESSLLDVSVEVELPIIANINDLVAREVIDFNNGSDLEEASRILLRVITENELPLGGNVELEFLDESENVVFTVTERPVFEAAPLGDGDRTSGSTTTTVDLEFADADIRAIESAVSIRVSARLSTTDATSGNAVKFFDDYELNITLAAQVDVAVGAN